MTTRRLITFGQCRMKLQDEGDQHPREVGELLGNPWSTQNYVTGGSKMFRFPFRELNNRHW